MYNVPINDNNTPVSTAIVYKDSLYKFLLIIVMISVINNVLTFVNIYQLRQIAITLDNLNITAFFNITKC